jgi:hypothetical protein
MHSQQLRRSLRVEPPGRCRVLELTLEREPDLHQQGILEASTWGQHDPRRITIGDLFSHTKEQLLLHLQMQCLHRLGGAGMPAQLIRCAPRRPEKQITLTNNLRLPWAVHQPLLHVHGAAGDQHQRDSGHRRRPPLLHLARLVVCTHHQPIPADRLAGPHKLRRGKCGLATI